MVLDGGMYNSGARKGELFELKQALNANAGKDRKNALKRVVAAMSLGRDMSSLFPDVVKNTTGDLSMKKLVYLYIINYAHANADLSLLIINTFLKDAADHNPLIRALAIRTMALIPLEKITECLCEPLHAALQDRDPYVRKTAAVCIAKLYDTNPTLTVEEGFLKKLQNLLSDANPMTVANAVAALSEIAQSSDNPSLILLNSETVPRLLSALSECTEWGQVFILDAISNYVPSNSSEADIMIERILPRLQHSNSAVVLASVRVMVAVMPCLDADDKRSFLVKKMSAPLVTLLSTKPEMQFVALRNLSLILRSYPNLISNDVRVLFVSYADPFYVKREKLDLLVQLADESNGETILSEFAEYAGEVDVHFAKRAVDSIATFALRIPSLAPRCVSILSALLKRKSQHLTERVVIAAKDVCRGYPGMYSDIVSQICNSVDEITDPTAKSALVWLVGEYNSELPNASEMLPIMLSGIDDEPEVVQIQALTACVKSLPTQGQFGKSLANSTFTFAANNRTNIELRDRGFMYNRMCGISMDLITSVVCRERPAVGEACEEMSVTLQKELLGSLSSIAAVYHKSPITFEGMKKKVPIGAPLGESAAEEDLLGLNDEPDLDASGTIIQRPEQSENSDNRDSPFGMDLLNDVLGHPPGTVTSETKNAPHHASPKDLLSMVNMSRPSLHNLDQFDGETGNGDLLLSETNGRGLEIFGNLFRGNENFTMLRLTMTNRSPGNMSGFAVQLNKNVFGFKVMGPVEMPRSLPSGASFEANVKLDKGGFTDLSNGPNLQIAIRFAPGGVVYFQMNAHKMESVLDRNAGGLSKDAYRSMWQSIPDSSEVRTDIRLRPVNSTSLQPIVRRLEDHGIFTVAKRWNSSPHMLYLCGTVCAQPQCVVLAELSITNEHSNERGVVASRCSIDGDVGRTFATEFNHACGRLLRQ